MINFFKMFYVCWENTYILDLLEVELLTKRPLDQT